MIYGNKVGAKKKKRFVLLQWEFKKELGLEDDENGTKKKKTTRIKVHANGTGWDIKTVCVCCG